MSHPLPVTLLTGFPDQAAHRLITSIQSSEERSIRAIVRKRRSKREQAKLAPWMTATTPRLMKLGTGCSCCTVRADLVTKVGRIAEEQSADHVVIISPLHDDMDAVAKTFTVKDDQRRSLVDRAQLQSLVVITDALRLRATNEPSYRAMIERIEVADVVLLTGDEADRILATELIKALNPHADVMDASDSTVPFDRLIGSDSFDLHRARNRAMENAADPLSDDSSSGVARVTFEARRPFHPTRLHDLLQRSESGLLRAHGTFWVASRPHHAAILDLVGSSLNTTVGGVWWDSVPKDQWPQDNAMVAEIERDWHPGFGDRFQRLVLIGWSSTEGEPLQKQLANCLVTDDEMKTPERWPHLPHPFPWPNDVAA